MLLNNSIILLFKIKPVIVQLSLSNHFQSAFVIRVLKILMTFGSKAIIRRHVFKYFVYTFTTVMQMKMFRQYRLNLHRSPYGWHVHFQGKQIGIQYIGNTWLSREWWRRGQTLLLTIQTVGYGLSTTFDLGSFWRPRSWSCTFWL